MLITVSHYRNHEQFLKLALIRKTALLIVEPGGAIMYGKRANRTPVLFNVRPHIPIQYCPL
jgi:hypothetical protein